MAVAKRFEELVAWQKARLLAQSIYSITNKAPFDRDFALRDQIRRSAISIMANIAEGYQRRKPGEFSQFLGYALGSCAEPQSHLYLASDIRYLLTDEFEKLSAQAEEVAKITYALRESIELKRNA